MKKKLKWVVNIATLCLCACLAAIGVFAASKANISLGGNISFSASNVYAKVDGVISGSTNDKTLPSIIFKEGKTPEEQAAFDTAYETWSDCDLNFMPTGEKISIILTIENYATDRSLYATVSLKLESTAEVNFSIQQLDSLTDTQPEEYIGDAIEIPAKETGNTNNKVFMLLTLELKDVNIAISDDATWGYNIILENDEPDEIPLATDYQNILSFSYTDSNTKRELNVSKGSNASGHLEIPGKVVFENKVLPVTTVGSFAWTSAITGLTLPNTITTIGSYAFSGCSQLASINIPNSVITIKDSAFNNCSLIKSIELPEGLKTIERSAFYGTGIVSIDFPDSLTTLGNSIFGSSLASYSIGDNITSVGINAIPISLCELYNGGYYLRTRSGKLAHLMDTETGITSLIISDDCKTIAEQCSMYKTTLTSIVIPEGVTSIGNLAFGSTGVTSVVIPNSVTYLGYSVFSNCASLTSLTIGNGLTIIEDSCFYNCTALTSVNIPNNIVSIGTNAFSGCSSLKNLTIGSGLTKFDGFGNCTALENISVASGTVYEDRGLNAIIEKDTNTVVLGCKGTTLNDTIKAIGNYAFRSVGFTSINIPNSVTSIGDSAFSGCTALTSINSPNSLTSIGNYAFYGCTALTSINNIPNSVTSIGDYTFYGCTALTSINISNSLTSIGNYTFYGCTALTSINNIPNGVISIGTNAFQNCSSLTSINIPNSVTTIGSQCFDGCTILSEVTIGTGLTSIGNYAFQNCSSLTSINIPNSVKTIGNKCFYGCTILSDVTIGTGITNIGVDVFSNGGNTRRLVLTIKASTPPVLAGTLTGAMISKVYIPIGSLNAYKTAENWEYCYSLEEKDL